MGERGKKRKREKEMGRRKHGVDMKGRWKREFQRQQEGREVKEK